MTQVFFGTDESPDQPDLDSNFTELYAFKNLFVYNGNSVSYGATSYAWNSSIHALEVGTRAVVYTGGGDAGIGNNYYYNGSGQNVYKASDFATLAQQYQGKHIWLTAATGTAGATFTFTTAMTLDASGNLTPGLDNTQRLGAGSQRWSTVYAGTGTINTSDAREKTAVTALTSNEIAAAKALAGLIGTYQWLEAVQAKGAGDARKHIGMTVQQAIAVMTANGLDPMAYGFICYDQWDAEVDEHGVAIVAAGDRYSFRPDELGMFIARGVAERLTAIEAQLAALTAGH